MEEGSVLIADKPESSSAVDVNFQANISIVGEKESGGAAETDMSTKIVDIFPAAALEKEGSVAPAKSSNDRPSDDIKRSSKSTLLSPGQPQKSAAAVQQGGKSRQTRAGGSKTPTCDIEGLECKQMPTFCHPGGSSATRCPQHKVAGMIRVEAAKPVLGLSSLLPDAAGSDTAPKCKHTRCKNIATHTINASEKEEPLYCADHGEMLNPPAYPAPSQKPPV